MPSPFSRSLGLNSVREEPTPKPLQERVMPPKEREALRKNHNSEFWNCIPTCCRVRGPSFLLMSIQVIVSSMLEGAWANALNFSFLGFCSLFKIDVSDSC